MTPVLQVFAKAPVPGQCKTRLIPALGAAGAATLHERLVRQRLATAGAWRANTPGARIELWCAPDASHAFFAACAAEFDLVLKTQDRGDLGARMWLALCGALAQGERPVLVGSDCPWLNAGDVKQAFEALDHADAVFAPAHDGGYVLVGLSRAVPELFAGIAWGSSSVMATTREAAARRQMRLAQLRTLHDLDTPADLVRLKGDALLEGLS